MHHVLVHYGEIALKGKNRSYFERKLVTNVKRLLEPISAQRLHGRMIFGFDRVDDEMLAHLSLMPGIHHFAPVSLANKAIDDIQAVASQAAMDATDGNPNGKRFKVIARRSDKRFQMTSPQLNHSLGDYLRTRLGMVVDLDHPEVPVHVEVCPDAVYIFTHRFEGIGGLPVGSSGRGAVMLSGGIDSPVAAFTMMKRGMEVVLIHFYNSTINRDFAKLRDLAGILSRYQPRIRMYLVDLAEFQRHAIAHIPAKYRMVIYKRQMIRVANDISMNEKTQAIITGDSLGQVASQTLANIRAIYDVSALPLLSPLIGMDKEEIIAMGRKIGTYDISIEEYCDICSYLIAKHPETKARRETIAALEERLPLAEISPGVRVEMFSQTPVKHDALEQGSSLVPEQAGRGYS